MIYSSFKYNLPANPTTITVELSFVQIVEKFTDSTEVSPTKHCPTFRACAEVGNRLSGRTGQALNLLYWSSVKIVICLFIMTKSEIWHIFLSDLFIFNESGCSPAIIRLVTARSDQLALPIIVTAAKSFFFGIGKICHFYASFTSEINKTSCN